MCTGRTEAWPNTPELITAGPNSVLVESPQPVVAQTQQFVSSALVDNLCFGVQYSQCSQLPIQSSRHMSFQAANVEPEPLANLQTASCSC